MKKIFYVLVSIFFFTDEVLSFHPTISLIAALTLQQSKATQDNEGFVVGTLINAKPGLVEIQDLEIGDSLVGLTNGEVSIITAISYQKVFEYIQIILESDSINAGIKQRFWITSNNNWLMAQELQEGDSIISIDGKSHQIKHLRRIKQDTILYKLSTRQHILEVSALQILAHNADMILSPIAIGCISTLNPVAVTIGTTLALGTGALLIYQKMHKHVPYFEEIESLSSQAVDLSIYEKQYYEEKKAELSKLKKELSAIKTGLLTLDQLSKNSFTFIFFTSTQSDVTAIKEISFDESNLNEKLRAVLRKNRETYLLHMEDEIIELQVQICFHFSELIDRVENACKKYNALCREVETSTTDWNLRVKNMSAETAYRTFNDIVRALYLIEHIETRMNELQIAVHYYTKVIQQSVLKRSTNIENVIKEVTKYIDQNKKTIETSKSKLLKNKQTVTYFLQSIHAPIAGIEKNTLSQLSIKTQQEESQEFQRAQNTFKQMPRHSASISQTSNAHHCHCGCGCESSQCGCNCGCPCKKERKVNGITKQDFFNNPTIKANYEHYRNGVYRLKAQGEPIVKNGFYLAWDHLHNDVEVYSKSRKHLGSLDPELLIIYKESVPGRDPF